ncbi:MAG: thioredoxin [Parachlamydiales bacterium]|jgi:thioredoxin 1
MSENVIELNHDSFSSTIQKGVVLVDFFAEWCGPCRMLSPIIEEISGSMKGKAVFAKIDIDKESHIASDYEVSSIPTLILFKDGKEINRIVGLRDGEAIKKFVEDVL